MNPVPPKSDGLPASGSVGQAQVGFVQYSTPAIPDHEPIRRIGHGSYGEVWLARNILGEFRAVKVIYRSMFDHERPFQREFEGIRNFEPISRSHPSQLSILHVGRQEQTGCFYYVMELADDAGVPTRAPNTEHCTVDTATYTPHTLKLELYRRERLPIEDAVQIGLALTKALEHLHAHGLVHRDIKPANIIFVKGMPKLADIGLVASVNATMSFVGTSGFLPPEGPGTAQADIYSLGKVLYEMSTGRDRQEFPKLPADFDQCDDAARLLELNAVVLKACALDPRQRYQSARDMAADLSLLQHGKSVRRKRRTEHRFSVLKKIALSLAVVAVVSGLLIDRLGGHKNPNPEVARLYSLARLHLDKTTMQGKQQALDCIQKALEIDPKFVPGYATLLEIYFWGGLVPDQHKKIKECAHKLLEINEKLPESHTAMAWVKFRSADWQGSEAELREALKLNPDYALAHYVYGYSLALVGRVSESHLHYERARQLNPTSREILTDGVYPFLAAREYEQALAHLQKALLLDPNYGCAHEDMAEIYEDQGRFLRAIEEWEKGEILDGEEPAQVLEKFKPLRQAYNEGGAKGYWLKKRDLMDGLLECKDLKDVPGAKSFFLAKLYAHLGDKEQALNYLEQARAEGHRTVELRLQPCWDALSHEPRFQAVLKAAGLSK